MTKYLKMSLWEKGKERGPLWTALSSSSSRLTSLLCVAKLSAFPYFLCVWMGQVVYVQQGQTRKHTHGYMQARSACMHRHLSLLKAEVKSHIKAESYRNSTVQRRQLPSWERQIVTLTKRF